MYCQQESISEYQSIHRQQNDQCVSLLKNLDLQQQSHRQWVAKHYRKLTSILNDNSQLKFYLTSQSKQVPEKVLNYSFDIKPYQYDRGIQTFSKVCCQSSAGKRKCEKPLIFKSGSGNWEAVKIDDFNVAKIKQNNRFNIKIQAQQHSTIVVTRQNNHPLRVQPEYRQNFKQNALIQINPPQTLGIVVTKEQEYFIDPPFQLQNQEGPKMKTFPFKLPSNYIRIEVDKVGGAEGQSNFMRRLGDQFMIRPEQTFDHGLSNSQGSNWHPFIGIQTQSRSRD